MSPPCRQVPNSGPSALVFSRGPEPLPVPAAATSTAQRPLSRQFEAGPGRDRGQRRRRGRVPAGRRDSVCRPAGVRRSAGGADWRSRRTWGRPHASALAARRPPPRELRAGGAAPGRGEEGGGTQPSRAERSRHEGERGAAAARWGIPGGSPAGSAVGAHPKTCATPAVGFPGLPPVSCSDGWRAAYSRPGAFRGICWAVSN